MSTEDLLLLSIAGYCFTALGIVAYIFTVRRAHVFDPIFQFIFFFSLFVLPLPIRSMSTLVPEGNVSDYLKYFYPYLPEAVLLASVSLVLFTVAYYSRGAKAFSNILPKPVDTPRDKPMRAFVILFGISLVLINILAGDYGILGLILLGYSSSAELFGRGHLAIGFPWAYVSSLFLLYGYALKRKRIYLTLFVVFFGAVTLAHIIMGNRSQVMFYVMTALFFWHYAIKKISYKSIVAIGISAFLALNVVGLLRASNYSDVDALVDRTMDSLQSVGQYDDGTGLFYTLTTGEFVVPFETLPQMIRRADAGGAYWWGETYARVPLFAIPSVVYPDRPAPLTNWYIREFYGFGQHATYGDGQNINEGRAFFFLSEAYLNFGIPGVLIVAILAGIFWGGVAYYMEAATWSKGAALLGALSIAFIFRCIAGDAVTLVIGLPQQCLSAAVILLLISMQNWQWKLKGAQ